MSLFLKANLFAAARPAEMNKGARLAVIQGPSYFNRGICILWILCHRCLPPSRDHLPPTRRTLSLENCPLQTVQVKKGTIHMWLTAFSSLTFPSLWCLDLIWSYSCSCKGHSLSRSQADGVGLLAEMTGQHPCRISEFPSLYHSCVFLLWKAMERRVARASGTWVRRWLWWWLSTTCTGLAIYLCPPVSRRSSFGDSMSLIKGFIIGMHLAPTCWLSVWNTIPLMPFSVGPVKQNSLKGDLYFLPLFPLLLLLSWTHCSQAVISVPPSPVFDAIEPSLPETLFLLCLLGHHLAGLPLPVDLYTLGTPRAISPPLPTSLLFYPLPGLPHQASWPQTPSLCWCIPNGYSIWDLSWTPNVHPPVYAISSFTCPISFPSPKTKLWS